MPWFMTPFGPQYVVEPGTVDEFERRDYTPLTTQQAADYFAGVAVPDPPSFATEAEVPGIVASAIAAGTGPVAEELRAAFVGLAAASSGSDDTAMLNAALTANRRVILRSGQTYRMAGLITVPAGHALVVAEGSTLLTTSASAGVVLGGQGSQLIGPGGIDGANLIDYIVTINGAGARVAGVTLRNSKTYGINLLAADSVIEGNVFDTMPSYAILGSGSAVARSAVRGNTMVACGQGVHFLNGPAGGVIADNIMQITTGIGIEVSAGSDFVITGNAVSGTLGIGISIVGSSGCVVDGNSVRGHDEIGIENTQGASHNVISNNNIGPSAAGTAVGIQDTTPDDTTNPQIGVTISGNLILGQSGSGILVQRGHAHNITGNVVEDCAGTGIYVENGDHAISGNTVRHSAPPASYVAMDVFGGPHTIRGNKVDLPASASGTIGIRCSATSDTQVDGNFVVNGAYGYAVNNGTRTVLNGNRSMGTTTASAFLFGSSATCQVLTHLSTVTSGDAVSNTGGATVVGPLITV